MSDISKIEKIYPERDAAVIAFDPGETTGYAVMVVDREKLLTGAIQDRTDLKFFDYGQIDCVSTTVDGWSMAALTTASWNTAGEYNGICQMLAIANSFEYAAIVCEDFIPDPKKFDQARHTLSPVRIMSGFSFGLRQRDDSMEKHFHTPFFIQNRSLAKTTCNNDRLRHYMLYDDKSGPHARDATRHAFYFLRDCSIAQPGSAYKRHLAWPHLYLDPATNIPDAKKKRPRKLGEII